MTSRPDLLARRQAIIDKVMALCVENTSTGCLVWQGQTSGTGRGGGYPRMCLDGQTVAVHAVVAAHFLGYIPGKKQIDHTCRNRLCLNHHHFDIVTQRENCRRRDGKKPRVTVRCYEVRT